MASSITMNAHSPQPNPPIAGYHFNKPYSYTKENLDAIIRTVSYHRKDFDLAVIWFPSCTHTNVVSSLAVDYRKPTTSLGDLDKLPLELLTNIFLQSDIASLFQLRQVNARGHQVVNALHEYRVITKHALNAFLALLRTRMKPGVTLQDFFRLLCTQECSLCGKYGNLVYLPTWTRCCSSCLHSDAPEIRSTNAARVKRRLELSKESMRNLPRLTTLPGTYSIDIDASSRSGRLDVVPTHHALSAFRTENSGTEPTMDMTNKITMPIVCKDTPTPMQAFMACCALPSYDLRTGQAENGVSCAGCQYFLRNIASRPHSAWAHSARESVYSYRGFLEHFAWCVYAQRLWRESKQGRIKPPSLPPFCKSGGFLSVKAGRT